MADEVEDKQHITHHEPNKVTIDNLSDGASSEPLDVASIHRARFSGLTAGHPDNPLILLVHGYLSKACSWTELMFPLAEGGYYVVAPDRCCFGQTPSQDRPSHSNLSPEKHALDLIALVERMGRSKVRCICGHDTGSTVAMRCVQTRSDMFETLVMISPPLKRPFGSKMKDTHICKLLSLLPVGNVTISQLYNSEAAPDRDLENELKILDDLHFYVPTLLLEGEDDKNVYKNTEIFDRYPVTSFRLWTRLLIAGAGHWSQSEQPDAVASNMLEFLSQQLRAPSDSDG